MKNPNETKIWLNEVSGKFNNPEKLSSEEMDSLVKLKNWEFEADLKTDLCNENSSLRKSLDLEIWWNLSRNKSWISTIYESYKTILQKAWANVLNKQELISRYKENKVSWKSNPSQWKVENSQPQNDTANTPNIWNWWSNPWQWKVERSNQPDIETSNSSVRKWNNWRLFIWNSVQLLEVVNPAIQVTYENPIVGKDVFDIHVVWESNWKMDLRISNIWYWLVIRDVPSDEKSINLLLKKLETNYREKANINMFWYWKDNIINYSDLWLNSWNNIDTNVSKPVYSWNSDKIEVSDLKTDSKVEKSNLVKWTINANRVNVRLPEDNGKVIKVIDKWLPVDVDTSETKKINIKWKDHEFYKVEIKSSMPDKWDKLTWYVAKEYIDLWNQEKKKLEKMAEDKKPVEKSAQKSEKKDSSKNYQTPESKAKKAEKDLEEAKKRAEKEQKEADLAKQFIIQKEKQAKELRERANLDNKINKLKLEKNELETKLSKAKEEDKSSIKLELDQKLLELSKAEKELKKFDATLKLEKFENQLKEKKLKLEKLNNEIKLRKEILKSINEKEKTRIKKEESEITKLEKEQKTLTTEIETLEKEKIAEDDKQKMTEDKKPEDKKPEAKPEDKKPEDKKPEIKPEAKPERKLEIWTITFGESKYFWQYYVDNGEKILHGDWEITYKDWAKFKWQFIDNRFLEWTYTNKYWVEFNWQLNDYLFTWTANWKDYKNVWIGDLDNVQK